MRCEGLDLEMGPPTVIYKGNAELGKIEEMWEIAEIRVREEYMRSLVELQEDMQKLKVATAEHREVH
jgi:predicted membrane GTPase involved in stress response